MTKIEELHYLQEILKRHNLPLSPILEYAIKEREEQYMMEEELPSSVCDEFPFCETRKELDDYCKEFANLSVGVVHGKKLPHKPLLLMSIIQLIQNGTIKDNRLELNKVIASEFANQWKKYIGGNKVPSVWTPFWHMKSEPFWHFKPVESREQVDKLYKPSIGKIRAVIEYAFLDNDLYGLICTEMGKIKLKDVLSKTYLA